MSIPVIAGLVFLAAQGPTTTPVTTTTAPSTTTTAPGCALTPATAKQGDLLWGVKKSFRQYVGIGLAGATGNSIKATDGATITTLDEIVRDGVANPTGVPTGAYRFTFGSADYTDPTHFTVHYRGTVAFSYPGHFFTLLLSDPSVTTAGGAATLHADIELKADPGAPAQPTDLPDVALANLTPPTATPTDGLLAWSNVPATLTSSEAFAGFYQAGADLDPVTLHLAADCAATPPPPSTATPAPQTPAPTENLVPEARYRPATTPALAATGVDAEHGFWAGVVLLLAGMALVLAAYRPARLRR